MIWSVCPVFRHDATPVRSLQPFDHIIFREVSVIAVTQLACAKQLAIAKAKRTDPNGPPLALK
jgi:hypothetical protein